MTKTPRTPRTAAFKKKVALEALREDQTLNQLASQYDIHPIQVGKWKKALVEGAESLFEGKKSRRQEESIGREALEKKVGQLTMENDFLKKNWASDPRGKKAMDRQKPKRAVRGSPMQTPRDLSVQLLLPTGPHERDRALADETHRRDVYRPAVFRLEENYRGPARRRPQHQPQTRPAHHETPWHRQYPARTPHLKTSPRTRQIPVLTQRPSSLHAPRGVELRHHLHSAPARLRVPRSHHMTGSVG